MRLEELAEKFGLELRGKPDHDIDGVGTLKDATPSQVSFLANPSYTPQLASTRAGAVLVQPKNADRCPGNVLIADDPYLAFARIASLFDARPRARPGIHETAVIHGGASIGSDVSIGPHAVIGEDCSIGDGSAISAGVVIGASSTVGNDCLLYPNVTLTDGIRLGDRVIIHAGAVIGADGFGIAFAKDDKGGKWEKVPQLGGVVIGNDCEIGANSCIDRGAIEDTVLEDDVRVDNHVQIGHNVHVGAHTAIAGSAGIAGSARIGRYCLIAGKAGVNGHVSIADRTIVAAGSYVMKNIEQSGQTFSTNIPAQPIRQWQRTLVQLLKLEKLQERIRKLEQSNSKENLAKGHQDD